MFFNQFTKDDIKSHFVFYKDGEKMKSQGIKGLENCKDGHAIGDGIFCFTGKNIWHDKTMILVNSKTGKMRKFLDHDGNVLIKDSDIDYDNIKEHLEYNPEFLSKRKVACYPFGFYTWFHDGYCVLSWMLRPDGSYYRDEDGFGGEDNEEENIYCAINTDFEIVVPFNATGVGYELDKLIKKRNSFKERIKRKFFSIRNKLK